MKLFVHLLVHLSTALIVNSNVFHLNDKDETQFVADLQSIDDEDFMRNHFSIDSLLDVQPRVRRQAETVTDNKSIPQKCGRPQQQRRGDNNSTDGGRSEKIQKMVSCCDESLATPPLIAEIKQLAQACRQAMGPQMAGANKSDTADSCGRSKSKMRRFMCVVQCIGQKKKIVDGNGVIVADVAKRYLSDLSKIDWQANIVEAISDNCAANANKPTETVAAVGNIDDNNALSCKKNSVRFALCVWRSFARACPKEKQRNNKICTKARESMDP